jgi:hypothetical protein
MQKNIGFHADDRSGKPGRLMRIGVGYMFDDEMDRGAREDYPWLLERIEGKEEAFDQELEALGGFTSPRSIADSESPGHYLVDPRNRPNYNDSWRFFGMALRMPEDREILTSLEKLTAQCRKVFDRIEESDFFKPAPEV